MLDAHYLGSLTRAFTDPLAWLTGGLFPALAYLWGRDRGELESLRRARREEGRHG